MENMELSIILGRLQEREDGAKERAKAFEKRFDGIDQRMQEDREASRSEITTLRNRIWGVIGIAFASVVGVAGLWAQLI